MNISEKCSGVNYKIFFFNTLKDDEKKIVLDHIASCHNCRILYHRIDQINHAIENHLDEEIISNYAILKFHSKEADYDRNKLFDIDLQKVDQHLKICNICRSKLIEMESLYSDMNKFWIDSDFPDIKIIPLNTEERKTWNGIYQNLKTLIENIQVSKRFRYGTIITAVSVFILIMFFGIDMTKSSLDDLAQLDEINIPISIRSGDTDELQKGILLFNQKKYSKAILPFQQFIENDLDSNNVIYAQYLLGLSYIKSAKVNDRTDTTLLDNGIILLNKVLPSMDNSNLKENILWFLGKAHLMKKDIINAERFFEKVNELAGEKVDKSREILKQLRQFK